MARKLYLGPQAPIVAALLLLAALAGWLLAKELPRENLKAAARTSLRRSTAGPQLVSVEALPPQGEMCEWIPASASSSASFQAEAQARAADTGGKVPNDADRPPVRVIRDTYPTYSAVAVDTNFNEVLLQDENLFGIKVFNRLDNTPPSANFTEPKRVLGGIQTKLEFNCGIYIDPKNGDVYSVNNDMVDTMVVFPRGAKGNVPPQRQLKTAHRTWGIAVDEAAQELYLTVEHPPQVLIYSKTAEELDQPIRTLEGNQTRLEDPHGIALDTENQWVFVSNHGSVSYYNTAGSGEFEPPFNRTHVHRLALDLTNLIRHNTAAGTGKFLPPAITVYPLKASGDTPPLRTIVGPKTQLNWPATLYADTKHGELYVANDVGDSILVFRSTDSGDAAPVRVIQGSKTNIKNPTGVFVDLKNDEVWVANMGNHSATVYPRVANGNVAPSRIIRSAPQGQLALEIGNPGAVGYDSKRKEILVPN